MNWFEIEKYFVYFIVIVFGVVIVLFAIADHSIFLFFLGLACLSYVIWNLRKYWK